MTEIDISDARIGDLRAIISIARTCGLEKWSLAAYRDELRREDSIIFVARTVNKDIVGFIAGRRVPGKSGHTTDAEIYNIGVRPEYRNQGIGRLLVAAFLRDCEEHRVRNTWLEVRASNEPALRFYTTHGFVRVGVRKRFYGNPVDDALVLRRTAH